MTEEYLKEFERWVAGPKSRKKQLRAELEEHLRSAEAAGDVDALKRLGTPREAAKTFSAGHESQIASLPRRIGAALVDMGVMVALVFTGMGTGAFAGKWDRMDRQPHYMEGYRGFDKAEFFSDLGVLAGILLALAFLWWVVVLPVLEWRYGQTLGKRLLGIRVVSEDGAAPKFGQIVLRRLTMIFSGPLQIIDWAFMFFTKKRQRAFDIVAKTVVVQDERTTTERLEPAPAA